MDWGASGKTEGGTRHPIIQASNYPVIQWVVCGLLLVTLGSLTWRQSEIYGDGETVWRATAARNQDCAMVHGNLAVILSEKGRLDEAITHFRKSLELAPDFGGAQFNLGRALLKKGQVQEALPHLERAVEALP